MSLSCENGIQLQRLTSDEEESEDNDNRVIPDTAREGLRELSEKNAKEIREDIVPVGGQLCKNQVIPATTREGLREPSEIEKKMKKLRQVNYNMNAAQNQKLNATTENEQNIHTAQVLPRESISSSSSSGGTTSLALSSILSSLQSGGASPLDKPSIPNSGVICTISPQVSTTISYASSSADNPTKGTSSSADTADNPDSFIFSCAFVTTAHRNRNTRHFTAADGQLQNGQRQRHHIIRFIRVVREHRQQP
jgi:hypothetical protein